MKSLFGICLDIGLNAERLSISMHYANLERSRVVPMRRGGWTGYRKQKMASGKKERLELRAEAVAIMTTIETVINSATGRQRAELLNDLSKAQTVLTM
jgi:hypothetical protein